MKCIIEGEELTVTSSDGTTTLILTEEDNDFVVVREGQVNNEGGLAAPQAKEPTLRDRAFELIERYDNDDDTEKKQASKLIARELFGTAGKKNLQRVAAYRASHTRSQQA